MNIRFPDNTSFKDEIKDLWRIAFGDTEAFLSAYFGGIWQGKNALAMLEDDKVIGALELVPYTLSVRNQDVKTSYIVGVSTLPSHRNRGVAKALMNAALVEQKRRGETFSLLIPFSYEFYEKMGYATCYNEGHSAVKTDVLPEISGGSFQVASCNDYEVLNHIYEIFCKDKNAFIRRSETQWQFVFSFLSMVGGTLAMYKDDTGTYVGYIAFLQDKKRFRVLEMAYENESGLSALLSFAKKEAADYETIDFLHPANAPALFGASLHPSAMARIVNVPDALSAGLGDVSLYVTDDFFPENSGVYIEENGIVQKTDSKPDVTIDIGSLTQLVLGFCSCKELKKAGRLTGKNDAINKLDVLYPKQENYINFILRDV